VIASWTSADENGELPPVTEVHARATCVGVGVGVGAGAVGVGSGVGVATGVEVGGVATGVGVGVDVGVVASVADAVGDALGAVLGGEVSVATAVGTADPDCVGDAAGVGVAPSADTGGMPDWPLQAARSNAAAKPPKSIRRSEVMFEKPSPKTRSYRRCEKRFASLHHAVN
jgi:hypothetical protein